LTDQIEIETGPNPDAAIIWLHGLGADGHDFEPIVPELRLPPDLSARFVFPHAPVRPVTINGGMAMRAWYDILSFDRDARVDEAGIRESAERLVAMIEAERGRGIDPSRIVIAGFSQGGAVALHAGLRHAEPLAGLMALSTYLPLEQTLAAEESEAGRLLPILMVHGEQDPVLPIALAEHSRDVLVRAGHAVEWHTFPMAHSVCLEEIQLIRRWLLERLRQS
jgi:phospholipase/carboxylesterase